MNQLIRNSLEIDGLNGLNGFSCSFECILLELMVLSGQGQYVTRLSGQDQYVSMLSGQDQYVSMLSDQGQYVSLLSDQDQYVKMFSGQGQPSCSAPSGQDQYVLSARHCRPLWL